MDDLCFQPITALAEAIAAGELSPVALTDAYLARIEALEPRLNAYITVTADAARTAAKDAENALREHGPRGPLHGIPLAYKDIVDVAGVPTTCGSQVLETNIPERDGQVVARLRDAGAIILGKLNMNEFATILPSEHFGPTVNPWHAEHTPGGSSSGSGVAVAAGLCAGALGTDTGGSIRLPSTYCAVTGLKATHGRVSNRGVLPLAWSLDHIGPMTRTAADAALILDAIAGYDREDLVSRNVPTEPTRRADGTNIANLRGRRLAWIPDFLAEFADPQVARALDAAMSVFRDLGAEIEAIELPLLDGAWTTLEPILCGEASTWHADYIDSVPERYGSKVFKFFSRAREVGTTAYVRGRGKKAAFKRAVLEATASFDALVVPGAMTPPPPPTPPPPSPTPAAASARSPFAQETSAHFAALRWT